VSHHLILKPRAEGDIQQAYCWYEDQRSGLGNEFLLSLEACLDNIKRNPLLYSYVHRELRRALVRRFPYGVFYLVEERTVVVLAVLDCRQDEEAWLSRYPAR
jgi:plasmid stabilization system protein ParE